ncbi:hypothetical protein HanRHA438_Chr04g0199391 [Helianthus annuus]|nr:hypothetical protein HanRHA438_Chr04g0199391 [Helianthus annuus]
MEKVLQILLVIHFHYIFAILFNHNLYDEIFLQQKIVVKVSMNSDKKTQKALQIAVGVSGKRSPFVILERIY